MHAPPAPAVSKSYRYELGRKAIHLAFILLPLQMLLEWLPWPRGRVELLLALLGLGVVFLSIDFLRMHDRRFSAVFRRFFGGMVRAHEAFTLLGSSYLVIAAIFAVVILPRPIAAAALGFTIVGDATAALVGKAWGRLPLFGKTLEGALGGLAACLAWGAVVHATAGVPWSVVIGGALVASLVELLPIPVDDNLGMTLISGFAMAFFWMPA
jgi:dolichol kinase